MNSSNIPVALFAYKRIEHLLKTLNGLKKNNVPIIYAFIDGPKKDSDIEQINRVHEILNSITWAQIKIYKSQSNLGLGTSIRKGIAKTLEDYDKVIVIEDDIVMRPGAYEYTCNALNFYETSNEVMSVSMWNHPVMVPKNQKNGFFSERFMCWGWGTYKKYWEKYTENIQDIYESIDNKMRDKIDSYGKDLAMQVEYSKNANIWYAGYAIKHFQLEKSSFFPPETLVVNIGKDETAENDGPGHTSYTEDESLINKHIQCNSETLPKPIIKKKVAKLFNKYFYLKHPFYKRTVIKIKTKLYFLYKPFKKLI